MGLQCRKMGFEVVRSRLDGSTVNQGTEEAVGSNLKPFSLASVLVHRAVGNCFSTSECV